MFSWKLFFIGTLPIAMVNIAYSIIQLYPPIFFETHALIFSSKIILLVVNSLFIIFTFLLFLHKKSIQNNLDEISDIVLNNPDIIVPNNKHITSSYTDFLLINNLPNLFCIKNPDGRWIQASSEFLKNIDLQYVDYVGKTDLELSPKSKNNSELFKKNIAQDKHAWEIKRAVKKHRMVTFDDGSIIQLKITSIPVFDENNEPFRLLVTGDFVLKKYNNKNKFELLDSIFSTSHLSFIILNEVLDITSTNDSFTSLLGYSLDDIKNKPVSCILNSKNNKNFCETLQAYFQVNDFQLWSGDVECKKKKGDIIIAKLKIKPILSKNDTFDHYFATLEDITLHKKNEKRIFQIAHYDDLTGLVNRVMFMDQMAKFLSAAKRHKLNAVILFIDLDNFKVVNDTLGHDAGDEVLKEIGKRLLSITRKEDVVARFSGDEFAILLLNERTHEKAIFSASLIAGKIIKGLSKMFYINRREVFVGSSIGISIFPEDGISSEVLLKHADIAMYEAKNKGRNNYQFYKQEYSVADQDRLVLENNLRNAIEKNELSLFYQPQYNAHTRELSGAEVLIRWFQDTHGKNKMIPPDHFIPIAEETGLIIEIGAWILEVACQQMKTWLNSHFAIPQVSVNVSARQFMDDNFMQSVENALTKAQLEPKYLELEITESMLIGDLKRIELQLKRLKKMGIKIALDDFGTGYSSLSYLKKFPIDILKIDQSFIRDMTVGSKDASIACAVIDLGHSLDQKIVAEGVENETQLMLLIEQKCDYIQGYYFSRPLPVYKMTALLEEDFANHSL